MFLDVLDVARAFLPAWPDWALEVLLAMTALLILTSALVSFYTGDAENSSKQSDTTEDGEKHIRFDKFRKQYLGVYLVIMLADWM